MVDISVCASDDSLDGLGSSFSINGEHLFVGSDDALDGVGSSLSINGGHLCLDKRRCPGGVCVKT